MKVSDLVVKCLEAEGVRYVFGLPGEEVEDLLFSLDNSSITFVPCRHEQGAAFIADVWGRLIPSPREGDSRGGFPKRGRCDSPWQTRGGLPWLRRLGFEGITRPRDCASWRSGRTMPIRRGACWRWRRSMTAGLGPRRRRSAGLGCKQCGTGFWRSTPRVRLAW